MSSTQRGVHEISVDGVTWGPRRWRPLTQLLTGLIASLVILANLAGAPGPASAAAAPAWTPPAGMFGTDVAAVTGVRNAWSNGATGTGIDVAIIDTGVNAVQGLAGSGKIIDGPDFSFDSDSPSLRNRDLFGHGTAMASLVAGAPPKGVSLTKADKIAVGMAPGARIVNVKVGDGVGAVDVSQVIAAVDWVAQHRSDAGLNIKVLLLAFDTDSSQSYLTDPLAYAVEDAWRKGITVVVAGGNDGRSANRLGNPAIDPYVIAVGAVDRGANQWRVPTWASSGDGVRNPDLAMPGQQILAAAVPGSYLANAYPAAVFTTPYGPVIRGNGTSQAAALTAGAAALLLQAKPNLTPDQVKDALIASATNIGLLEKFAGRGLVNAQGAIDLPTRAATQSHPPAAGTGTLEASRGSYHVGPAGQQLMGETTAFGDTWAPAAWTAATAAGRAFVNETWSGSSWLGGSWLSPTWSGATWSGATWSGATWSGATWSGATWSGATWSGATWSGATWSGRQWV